MSTGPVMPPLDVLAVLADLQQQLTDLTGVVQAQQRTLQHLVGPADADRAAAPASASAPVRPAPRRL
jgi:hypothetical protein